MIGHACYDYYDYSKIFFSLNDVTCFLRLIKSLKKLFCYVTSPEEHLHEQHALKPGCVLLLGYTGFLFLGNSIFHLEISGKPLFHHIGIILGWTIALVEFLRLKFFIWLKGMRFPILLKSEMKMLQALGWCSPI